ncbi:MAG: phosphoribosylamine--glycine ligase, partial [Myxococcota bacterium]
MRVLVVGRGAREHALCWRLSGDREVDRVFAAPGNAGTAHCADNVSIQPNDISTLLAFSKQKAIDLVVVGPEAPLVGGLVDRLEGEGIAAFGPRQQVAELEGSKVFAKEFMRRHRIPTAPFRVFDDADEASQFIEEAGRPLVVKAEGLAAGKGVFVASSVHEAREAVDRIMRHRDFGAAGNRIVIEERLQGEEVSYHVVSDGQKFVTLAPAQDHKRLLEGDEGPNTGGMGAYSPPSVVDAAVERRIQQEIVEPTLAGLSQEGRPFRGALFVGLMVHEGAPRVLEYNVRFGDPECTCIMARWKGSVLPLLLGAAQGDLSGVCAEWEAPCALSVVLASQGYPAPHAQGMPIAGLERARLMEPEVVVFHAGTKADDAAVHTAGGRVLTVTGIGDTIDAA